MVFSAFKAVKQQFAVVKTAFETITGENLAIKLQGSECTFEGCSAYWHFF